MTLAKNINAVRFTIDGSKVKYSRSITLLKYNLQDGRVNFNFIFLLPKKILAATTARRLAVVDVERGEQLLAYDNCAFSGRERVGVATDPVCPSLAVCVSVNGKGLTLLDLRMPLPLEFFYEVSKIVDGEKTVREIVF